MTLLHAPIQVPDLSDERIVRRWPVSGPSGAAQFESSHNRSGEKLVIHNYGHGGGGVTLSWGSGEEVARLLADMSKEPVAVVGAGAVGLAAAAILRELDFPVTIYAAVFSPFTTSDLAGAAFSPELVSAGETAGERARFERMVGRSWKRFERLASWDWGVSRRTLFVEQEETMGLDTVGFDVLPQVQQLERLPFGTARPGRVRETFLIEPPVYLSALMKSLREKGVAMVRRAFATREELQLLPERIIVNCTGLGSASLFDDEMVHGIRGHLVHFRPDRSLELFNFRGGYIYPRRDVIVVGTSAEWEWTTEAPDQEICRSIVSRARCFLEGEGG